MVVERIDKPSEKSEPVKFTHRIDNANGIRKTSLDPSVFIRVVYLGKCEVEGDMFAAYNSQGGIYIFKGHLNSGTY